MTFDRIIAVVACVATVSAWLWQYSPTLKIEKSKQKAALSV